MNDKGRPGFISIHRKIQDNWIWQDPERFRAWMDILLCAQFADSEVIVNGVLIKVPRGSWFVSQRTLQTRWGWSRTKVSMFLNMLVSEQMLDVKKTTRGSVLKVLNYDIYQDPSGRKKATDQTTHQATDCTTDQTTDWTTDQATDVHHNNKANKANKANKVDKTFLARCTYSKEEGDAFSEQVKSGKNPFPNAATEDAYWKEELEHRRAEW